MTAKFEMPAFSRARMLVCGDLMLDRYWYGQTARISPEAPVPVVAVNQLESRPGGAANVACNLSALNCSVKLLGLVGNDPEGRELKTILQQQGVECHFQELDQYTTVTKLRVISQNQQLLRLDFEKTTASYDDDSLQKTYQALLSETDVVVLSDYAKGALVHAQQLIQAARALNIPVLVDPKSVDLSRYDGATLLTPNLKEFEAIVGFCQNDADIISKAKKLIAEFNFEAILITRGKQGMLLVHHTNPPLNLSAHAREVYDVTGAGDTVIALLAASLGVGLDLEHATILANLAAGIVVRKLGAASVSVSELRRELQQYYDSEVNILSEQELLTAVLDAKAHGEKIVMTNGCFDLLHAGHVEYLESAKTLGDRLIVAVNDDASVRALKGEHRPLNPLAARMELLAALRAVDWVVSFAEQTPERLIAAVLPDVLVKGADYTIDQIAGADVVIKNGGTVSTLPLKSGFSTSRLIEKIKEETPA